LIFKSYDNLKAEIETISAENDESKGEQTCAYAEKSKATV